MLKIINMKKLIRINDRIWFGKYKGSRVSDLIRMDSKFILNLTEKFILDKKILDGFEKRKISKFSNDNFGTRPNTDDVFFGQITERRHQFDEHVLDEYLVEDSDNNTFLNHINDNIMDNDYFVINSHDDKFIFFLRKPILSLNINSIKDVFNRITAIFFRQYNIDMINNNYPHFYDIFYDLMNYHNYENLDYIQLMGFEIKRIEQNQFSIMAYKKYNNDIVKNKKIITFN